jgi:hypothetical protein
MISQINVENVHLYKNVYNILWEHLIKFEMNSMNIEYPKAFFKAFVN